MESIEDILREVEAGKEARAKMLPTDKDCIDMMVQCRLRLLELGWRSGEYAPKDGTTFLAVNAGFSGPVVAAWMLSSFFLQDAIDLWPMPQPLVFKAEVPKK